jgi:cell division protein FtsZ
VLDEKMKDEVKITVIATGFKADQIRRREHSAAAVAVPQPHFEPAPPPIHYDSDAQAAPPSSAPEPPSQVEPGPPAPPPSSEPVLEEPVTRTWQSPTPVRENASIESVTRGLKGEFEPDDLDVPAFLRKRNESR